MSVATKNPFAYLGNDSDGEEKPVVPVKTVDKAPTNTHKRGVEPTAPVRGAGAGGNRRGGPGGNEGAFRDRNAGSNRNHQKSTDETPRDGPRGGFGARGRGGRGARYGREGEDRHHAKYGGTVGGGDKAAAKSAAAEGEAELNDEQAGEAIAQTEKKEANAEDAAPVEEPEEEDKSVSYADYLAQQAEKKAALESGLSIRGANEGSKPDKKWANAKALPQGESEEVYFAPSAGKKQRERERKVKQTVDFDPRFVEPERTGRGGRGGPRGGAPRGGRGGERGERGERSERSERPERGERSGRGGERGGRGRGGERGARGGADRGAPRGGNRGGAQSRPAAINTSDESAFPSLGGK
jgi:plasminogen activator inhibitor 1 RNA-binding protein